jgi:hypothetical protein
MSLLHLGIWVRREDGAPGFGAPPAHGLQAIEQVGASGLKRPLARAGDPQTVADPTSVVCDRTARPSPAPRSDPESSRRLQPGRWPGEHDCGPAAWRVPASMYTASKACRLPERSPSSRFVGRRAWKGDHHGLTAAQALLSLTCAGA